MLISPPPCNSPLLDFLLHRTPTSANLRCEPSANLQKDICTRTRYTTNQDHLAIYCALSTRFCRKLRSPPWSKGRPKPLNLYCCGRTSKVLCSVSLKRPFSSLFRLEEFCPNFSLSVQASICLSPRFYCDVSSAPQSERARSFSGAWVSQCGSTLRVQLHWC